MGETGARRRTSGSGRAGLRKGGPRRSQLGPAARRAGRSLFPPEPPGGWRKRARHLRPPHGGTAETVTGGQSPCHDGVVVEWGGKPWQASRLQWHGGWDRPSPCVACRASQCRNKPTDDKKRSSVPPARRRINELRVGFRG